MKEKIYSAKEGTRVLKSPKTKNIPLLILTIFFFYKKKIVRKVKEVGYEDSQEVLSPYLRPNTKLFTTSLS